jgi:hypothetical protein
MHDELRKDNQKFHELLFNSLPSTSKDTAECSVEFKKSEDLKGEEQILQCDLPKEADIMIEAINWGRKELKKDLFDRKELSGKSEADVLSYLKVKQLESEFDVNEATMC